MRLTTLNFRSPVAVILGIVALCCGLLLLVWPFSAVGISCGTALTPRTIEINAGSATQSESRLAGRIQAQSDCASGVDVRRYSGAPLVLVGIAAITIGATPRWRRRDRRHRHRSRHHRRSGTRTHTRTADQRVPAGPAASPVPPPGSPVPDGPAREPNPAED